MKRADVDLERGDIRPILPDLSYDLVPRALRDQQIEDLNLVSVLLQHRGDIGDAYRQDRYFREGVGRVHQECLHTGIRQAGVPGCDYLGNGRPFHINVSMIPHETAI